MFNEDSAFVLECTSWKKWRYPTSEKICVYMWVYDD